VIKITIEGPQGSGKSTLGMEGYGIAGEAVYFHPLEEVKEAVWQLKQ
jgi:cytidylate kinase